MSKELMKIVAQMKQLAEKAEGMMGVKPLGKDEGAKKGVGASVSKQRHQKGVNYDTGVSDSSYKGGKYKPENIKGGISSAGMSVRMGDMPAAKDKHKGTLADQKAMPKPKLTKGTPKVDDEESKPLPPGEKPSNEKPFEDPSPEDQSEDNVPAGEEAPAQEEPQLEDQAAPDVDQDGAPDSEEDHGAIDPEQADANGDGEVSHDEADAAAPGGGEQGDGYTYLAGDGDSIGAKVGQAMLHDDVEGLSSVSKKINQGQEAFQQWLQGSGGEMISAGGDEFVARIPKGADMSSLEQFRDQYNQTVGATVTIGLGGSMSQAGKALIYGKLNGKNQVAQYSPEMEDFLQGIQSQGEQDPQSEAGKQSDHYLNSVYGDQPQQPGQEGQMPEQAVGEEPMADEAAGAPPAEVAAAVDEPGEVPPVEDVDMDQNLSQKMAYYEAPEASLDGGANPIESTMSDAMQGGDGQYLKQQMMSVLEGFKKDKEFVEHLKGSNPEAYQETIALLHQMIKTAKLLNQPSADEMNADAAPVDDEMSDGPIGDAMDAADAEAPAGEAPEGDKLFPPKGEENKDSKGGFPPKKDAKSDKKDDKKDDKSDKKPEGKPEKKDDKKSDKKDE